MKGIDIIIPVHKYDDDVKALLNRCLTSVNDMIKATTNDIKVDIQIVVPNSEMEKEISSQMVTWTDKVSSVTIAENKSGEFDFCSQVNYATNNLCKNEFFMVVEYDDMVTEKWLNMAYPYIKTREKCPLFLPLVEVYDIKDSKKPKYYVNEIGWSSSFSENELGSLTNNLLMDYCNFNITGAIINTNKFNKSGGLKPSIKVSFGYELLLRLSQLYGEVYVIPKVGYFHFINRDDSLTAEYHKTMTQEEGSWWIKLATQEYLFKKDRNKTYNPDEKE